MKKIVFCLNYFGFYGINFLSDLKQISYA